MKKLFDAAISGGKKSEKFVSQAGGSDTLNKGKKQYASPEDLSPEDLKIYLAGKDAQEELISSSSIEVIKNDDELLKYVKGLKRGKFVKFFDHWCYGRTIFVGLNEDSREKFLPKLASEAGTIVKAYLIQPEGCDKPVLIIEEVDTKNVLASLNMPSELYDYLLECCKDSYRPLRSHLCDPSGAHSTWTHNSSLAIVKKSGDYRVDVDSFIDVPEEMENNPVFFERLKAKVEGLVKELMPANLGKLNVTFDGSKETLKKMNEAFANGQSFTLKVSKGYIAGNLILREPKIKPRYNNGRGRVKLSSKPRYNNAKRKP